MMVKRWSQIVATVLIALVLAGGTWSSVFSAQIPLIYIKEVKCDESVSIRSAYFPAALDFKVTMNRYGTLGIGGTLVDTVSSAGGGELSWTFTIPADLKGQQRIAIRLENAPNGFYSYNWFWNNTPATCGGGSAVSPLPSGVIPTFSILTVEKDSTVTIRTSNLPANDKFDVLMNTYGTLGVGGVKVTQVDSGTGGTKEFTFTIPDSLKGQEKIAIRLQSPVSAYYAYNWFWNNSTSGSSSGPAPTPVPGSSLPAGVIPTISISAVVKDSTVTFVTKNFPANDSFEITMNYYGTLGVGGVKVGTLDTGSGGTLTFTADIPKAMQGQPKIAIRLYSSKTGYFAYNWFWNNNAP
jgi:hypothetical protein